MRVLIFLALLGAAFAASPVVVPSVNQQRIVGGSPTTINQYPFMANMLLRQWGGYWYQYCGGALITPTSILSAAHCYYGPPFNFAFDWRVILGSSFASSGGTMFTVSQLINHPIYRPATLDYDIAVVILSSPATLSPTIATASIAGANYNLAPGTSVTAIGWGVLQSEGASPEQLHHVELDIIDQSICAERYKMLQSLPGYEAWPDITSRMVCAGVLDEGGRDACQGDSGGPLLHNNVIYGVVSWGFRCADPFFPGVKARVSDLSSWVVANAV